MAFGNTQDRLNAKQQELQQMVMSNYGINLDMINRTKREVNKLLHKEEVFWRKRSRAIWLMSGDKNTKFFHQRVSQRRQKNHIEGQIDMSGVWHTEEDKVAEIAMDYYKALFSASAPTHMPEVLDTADKVVSCDMRHILLLPYTENEVWVALFQMHLSKSPGPDNMSPYFFQKFWHIIGSNVTSAILSVLHSRRYL